ncbi:MAG: hypothetical protein COZ18_13510 [Flexibacter sp. CG_4_10_14_3_um_filter_32_15]|nr:MAG: hypothetical protein COZ18_13510 [Flexibacter sp. CG_4_10_14_3_um_filter_32_15]
MLFFKCSSPRPIQTITVPFPHLDVPFQTFKFSAENGTQVRLSSGTFIQIPANALTDTEGNVVTGEVELAFREVEETINVFRTGITMKYDSAERKGNFQTAGMFEIKVRQGDKELQVKKGENVTVGSASNEGDADYSFYNLDKEKGWNYQTSVAVDSNFYKKRKLDSLNNLKEKVYPFGKEYFAFNYDVLLDVYFNDNRNRIDKNRKNRRVRRKIERYGVQRLESRIPYEILKTKATTPLAFWLWKFNTPTNIPKWIDNYYNKVEIKKNSGSSYTLTIMSREDKSKKWVKTIQPVIPISQMYAHTPSDWRKNFRKYIKKAKNSNLQELEKINKEMEMVELQKDFIRKANISGFGIYNYDRWRNEENKVTFTVSFSFDAQDKKEAQELVTTVWVIPSGEKSVMQWHKYKDEWDKAMLLPDKKVRICAVLPNKKIAIFEESEFEKLNFEEIKRTEKHTFHLKTYPQTIETTQDLEMALYGKLLNPEELENNKLTSFLELLHSVH